MNEIGARLAEETLGSERFIERIVQKDKSLAQRILAKIRDLIDAFRTLGNKEARAEYKRLRTAEKLYMEAMEKAGVKYARETIQQESQKNSGDNGRYGMGEPATERENKAQWALNTDNYKKRLASWDGQTEGFSFVLGITPTYLSEMKIGERPLGKRQVRIDASKVKKIMRDHSEMTIEVISKLPELLENPIVVMDSKTVKDRLVLLGEVYANGKPVMMILELNPKTRNGDSTYADIIKVASAYSRDNLQNMLNTSKIRFVNKNKSRVDDWLKVNRLQLPLPNSQSDSATNSISENPENVNTKSQFSLPPADEELMRETARCRDFNYSEGQKAKAEANENQNKVYTQRDAAAIVSSVLSEHMSFGEVYGNLHGKSRKEIVFRALLAYWQANMRSTSREVCHQIKKTPSWVSF